MPTSVEVKDSEVQITITGRFDFSQHKQFKDCYEKHDQQATSYSIDLGCVDYIDSSALGMLLILREHAGGASARIALKNCSPEVKKLLKIANFEKLFTIG